MLRLPCGSAEAQPQKKASIWRYFHYLKLLLLLVKAVVFFIFAFFKKPRNPEAKHADINISLYKARQFKEMKIAKYRFIEFFSGTSVLAVTFKVNTWHTITLDRKKYRDYSKPTYQVNFENFDYKKLASLQPTVLWFGLPCTCWSKASGGYHFSDNFEPKTELAKRSINQIKRVFEIIDFLKPDIFFIENPSSGLYRYLHKSGYFKKRVMHVERFDLKYFGSRTQKKTDLITNLNVPFFSSPVRRVNNIYQKENLANLTYIQRIEYPQRFCDYIFFLCSSQLNYKKEV